MSEKQFIDGMIFKIPEKAPDFLKGKLSIKLEDFSKYIHENHKGEQWINIDLKVSKAGKPYAELNTWKPDKDKANQEPIDNKEDDDLPFN